MGIAIATGRRNSPIILSQGGLPVGIPSSGTIGNNGALSAITALPTTYSGGIYLYFPANAISAGSAAGLYYCVMSSTTAGTIYNNTYTSGVPRIPASPTAFATTGPGAYTQSTAELTVHSVSLPGGLIGPNGGLSWILGFQSPSNANNKGLKVKIGATTVDQLNLTTNTGVTTAKLLSNRGVQNSQILSSPLFAGGIGFSSGAFATSSADTSVTSNLTVTLQNASASDYSILETWNFQVSPS